MPRLREKGVQALTFGESEPACVKSVLPNFWLAVVAIAFAFCAKQQSVNPRRTDALPHASIESRASQTDEYFAWEKTFDDASRPHYKQVKKNYKMDKEICRNVIQVLADAARSPQVATYSEFECWPASMNPNEYYRKYSTQSDEPSNVVFPSK